MITIPFRFNEVQKVLDYLHERGMVTHGCGCDEGQSSLDWIECFFIDAMKNKNFNVIDWGCGYGRFLNYLLKKKVNKFKYYGFETETEKHGKILIDFCKTHYVSHEDKNKIINFGYITDDSLFEKATDDCSVIILASVLTHISFEKALNLFKKFDKFISSGGEILFTIFFAKGQYRETGKARYGTEDQFSRVFYTKKELDLLSNNKYNIKEIKGGKLHGQNLFKLTLK